MTKLRTTVAHEPAVVLAALASVLTAVADGHPASWHAAVVLALGVVTRRFVSPA